MISIRKALLAAVLVVAAIAPSRASFADSLTFNSIFFRPATGPNTYLMLYDTQTLRMLQFDAGLYFDYAYDPLNVRIGTQPTAKVINNMLVGDFVAAIGAMDFLEFGVDVPFVLLNSLLDPYTTGATRSNFMDMGDIRLEAKARVLDACRKHIGLAFVPFITFPTGKSAHFVGEPGFTGGLVVALDGRIHPRFGMTLNVGYQGGKKTTASNVSLQHKFLVGLGAEGNFDYGIDAFGEVNAEGDLSKLFGDVDNNPTEAMAGVRWNVKQTGVTLHAGFGTCLVCGVKGARFRSVIGAKYRLMTPKFKAKEMTRGPLCSSAYAGFTKSQLYNLAQNCPADPTEWKEGVHDDACPKYYELKELATLVLRCPAKAEDFDPRYHDQACPKVFDLSQLYSPEEVRNIVSLGLAEMSLVCPDDPANFNAQIHDQACPKYYDFEESRVLAKTCPPPENFKSGVDDAACPKYYELIDTYGEVDWGEVDRLAKVESQRYGGIRGGEIQTFTPVYFDFNSSVIRSDSISGIEEVVAFINATPWISTVNIGGHADAIGTSSANETISLRRSRAVIEYMRSHGLRSGVELQPVAYGSAEPAAANDTEEGRKLNRRVVFMITDARYGGHMPKVRRPMEPVYQPVYEPVLEPMYEEVPLPSAPVPAPAAPVDITPTPVPAAPAPIPPPAKAPTPPPAQPYYQPVYQPLSEPEDVAQPLPQSGAVINVPPAADEGMTGDLAPEVAPRRGQ